MSVFEDKKLGRSLSVAKFRKVVGDVDMTDEQIEDFIDALYIAVEKIIDNYLDKQCKIEV